METLGEYRLLELKKETACNRLWLAEQTSIHRRVAVLERKSSSPQAKEDFLADIRAKASVEHPLVGSVYEASGEAERSFAALEFLTGKHLAHRVAEAWIPEPLQLALLLRRIADAFFAIEAMNLNSAPVRLADLFLDDHGVVRLKNLVIRGERNSDRSVADVSELGAALPVFVAQGRPGATRLLLLLSWMRGDGLDAPVTWAQVRDYCAQIEQQLSDSTHLAVPRQGSSVPRWVWVAAGIVVLGIPAALVFSGVFDRPAPKKARAVAALPAPVSVPEGKYQLADGSMRAFRSFQIAAHETTIREYQEFLAALETLSVTGKQRIYDHPDEPAEKENHVPDDWVAMLAAAKAGSAWKGHDVTLDTPVTGVDWWDAMAFARWKQGDLPEPDEWYVSLGRELKHPEKIPATGFLPVDPASTDRSPSGLLGMAGSVSEWLKSRSADPSNPLGFPRWVLAGGSYAKPGTNVLTREWVDDRSLRRDDVGFRVVFRPSEK